MDKWERRDNGYREDWPDGIYEVTHVIYLEQPLKTQQEHGWIVEIKDGDVHVDGIGVPGGTPKDKVMIFSQGCFFEVNAVIDYLKEI